MSWVDIGCVAIGQSGAFFGRRKQSVTSLFGKSIPPEANRSKLTNALSMQLPGPPGDSPSSVP